MAIYQPGGVNPLFEPEFSYTKPRAVFRSAAS